VTLGSYRVIHAAFDTRKTAAAVMRLLLCQPGMGNQRTGLYFSCLRIVGRECRNKIRHAMWAAGMAGEWGDYYRYNLRLITVWRWLFLLALYSQLYRIGMQVDIESAIDNLAEFVSGD
jgi:hypothetical protein